MIYIWHSNRNQLEIQSKLNRIISQYMSLKEYVWSRLPVVSMYWITVRYWWFRDEFPSYIMMLWNMVYEILILLVQWQNIYIKECLITSKINCLWFMMIKRYDLVNFIDIITTEERHGSVLIHISSILRIIQVIELHYCQ